MREKEIKYSDALVLIADKRFYRGEVTVRPNSIDLSLSIFLLTSNQHP